MRITKSIFKQIIKEELISIMREVAEDRPARPPGKVAIALASPSKYTLSNYSMSDLRTLAFGQLFKAIIALLDMGSYQTAKSHFDKNIHVMLQALQDKFDKTGMQSQRHLDDFAEWVLLIKERFDDLETSGFADKEEADQIKEFLSDRMPLALNAAIANARMG